MSIMLWDVSEEKYQGTMRILENTEEEFCCLSCKTVDQWKLTDILEVCSRVLWFQSASCWFLSSLFNSENGSDMLLRNIDWLSLGCMTYPRRYNSLYLQLWEPQIELENTKSWYGVVCEYYWCWGTFVVNLFLKTDWHEKPRILRAIN
jgi:hypothetical protein